MCKATLVIVSLPENGKVITNDCIQFEKAEILDYSLFDLETVKDHKTSWTFIATNKASKYLGMNIKIGILYGVGNLNYPYHSIFAGIPREATEDDKIKLRASASQFIVPNRFKGVVSKNGSVAPDYILDNKALRAVMKKIIGG